MLQSELIEQCRINDRKAQMKLYNKYCDGMYYVALRFLKDPFEAEEAMQESFIKAFMKLHQFTGDVTFGAWLKRIVINKSIDMLKAKKMNMVAINEQVMGTVEEQNDWSVSDSTTVEEVKSAIERLPEKYKYAVMLFLIEGYDHKEISEILDITPVASRTLVHRGKKQLQDQLKHLRDGTGY
ncbi:sigma-70 family RNA polymerase sigma factor [uncultured Aquimarina sp.]|uniref:RNA polymerase sigma factor n=1 Tax=uncultured Aquimarina sp. TaxID=575652 RepID=UPI00260FF636|nr:sigma-70 family RNA polymerase sigma factor [uncultured Aquimarina sp.]